MFKMDKIILKQQILEKCREAQVAKIDHLEVAIKDSEVSILQIGQVSDMFDTQRMQMIQNRDMYAGQLKGEVELLETLHKIDLSVKADKVGFGTIVITDKQKVFISIGLGKIKIENEEFYAISAQVPFYTAIKDKKIGEDAIFRDQKIKILDIY